MTGGRALSSAVIVAIAWLLGGLPASAQIIRVPGTIKDDSGRPVRGAVITADNPDQTPARLSATSNDKGQFGFIGIRRGLWTITVQAPGFEPLRFQHQVAAAARQDSLDVRLSRTAVPAALPLDNTRASDIQARIDRAEAATASGDVDGAIGLWRDLLAKVPALTSVHLRLGELYERKPDREAALAAYRQLLVLDPANDKARAAVDRLTAAK